MYIMREQKGQTMVVLFVYIEGKERTNYGGVISIYRRNRNDKLRRYCLYILMEQKGQTMVVLFVYIEGIENTN